MRLNKINVEQETLKEAMQQFLKVKEAEQVSGVTMRDYKRFLNSFCEFSSNTLNDEVLGEEVIEYFARIPDTSPSRYNHPYKNLNAFFNWAVSKKKLTENPITAQGLHKKKDDGNIKPATIEDVKKFLNSFDKNNFAGFRNYTMTLLMLDTGIRTSELRRLKDDAFDPSAKTIFVDKIICKTRKNRIIYLSDTTAKAISKLIKVKPHGFSELIFPTVEGREMSCEGLSKEFNKQCKRVGVKFTPYQLRHSFATYFISNGGDVFTLQNLMGHADLRTTKRYVEVDENRKKEAHEVYSPINAIQGSSRLRKVV